MSIGRRLRETIQSQGMNLTDFSKKSGIQYRTLQDYIADKIMPGSESLIKIHEQLRVSLNWLLTGEGSMYSEPEEPLSSLDNLMKNLTKHQQQTLLGIANDMFLLNKMVEKLGEKNDGE